MRNSGCPFCKGKKLCVHTSIQFTHPNISKEWHTLKNGNLKPTDFKAQSNKKVWWLCDKKCPQGCLHEWETTISNRCHLNNNCPYCSIPQNKICTHMSISYTHPDIAKQWHPTKNDNLKPTQVSQGSNKKVWWLCDKKCPQGCLHEWLATINHRTSGNRGCPICSRKKVCIHNSIYTTHPELMTQWHPSKNNIDPKNISYGSDIQIWWKCLNNNSHEWQSRISSRTITSYSCPQCKYKTEENLQII
jgi:hypothetical protein